MIPQLSFVEPPSDGVLGVLYFVRHKVAHFDTYNTILLTPEKGYSEFMNRM